jgi:molybdate transport system permease protein
VSARRGRRGAQAALVAGGYALGGGLLVFLLLPLVALFVTTGPAALIDGLRHPITGPALILSVTTTAVSLALILVLGTPLAWWLARSRTRAARVVESVVQLPIVIPPAVAGLALLLAFGRHGLVGPMLLAAGIGASFSTTAVVMAQTFVAAPFYVRAASAAFAAVDEDLLVVARTLGASRARVLLRVALPLAGRGLVAGAALAWARALGEFGATLMFAGNLAGRTQTLPLAVYEAMESDLRAAQALSIVLVLVAMALLTLLRRPSGHGRPHPLEGP